MSNQLNRKLKIHLFLKIRPILYFFLDCFFFLFFYNWKSLPSHWVYFLRLSTEVIQNSWVFIIKQNTDGENKEWKKNQPVTKLDLKRVKPSEGGKERKMSANNVYESFLELSCKWKTKEKLTIERRDLMKLPRPVSLPTFERYLRSDNRFFGLNNIWFLSNFLPFLHSFTFFFFCVCFFATIFSFVSLQIDQRLHFWPPSLLFFPLPCQTPETSLLTNNNHVSLLEILLSFPSRILCDLVAQGPAVRHISTSL